MCRAAVQPRLRTVVDGVSPRLLLTRAIDNQDRAQLTQSRRASPGADPPAFLGGPGRMPWPIGPRAIRPRPICSQPPRSQPICSQPARCQPIRPALNPSARQRRPLQCALPGRRGDHASPGANSAACARPGRARRGGPRPGRARPARGRPVRPWPGRTRPGRDGPVRGGSSRYGQRLMLAAAAGPDGLNAAQHDASHDRCAASQLDRPDSITEQRGACCRADERLQVHERAGDVGGHFALRGREQGRRQHGPGQHERDHR